VEASLCAAVQLLVGLPGLQHGRCCAAMHGSNYNVIMRVLVHSDVELYCCWQVDAAAAQGWHLQLMKLDSVQL
jgi:hypothetical protein